MNTYWLNKFKFFAISAAPLLFLYPEICTANSTTIEKLRILEQKVWTASENELAPIEQEVVRQIQIDPNDEFPFYLLAHLRLREFTNAPDDLAVIKQAADLAQQTVDLAPESDLGYVVLAETLDIMGQSSKGIQLLESASESGVEPSWRIYFTLARLYAESAPKDRILGLLEQALFFKNTQPEIIIPYVVAVLQTTADGIELISDLHDWDRKFPHVLIKQTLAITFANQSKFKEAHIIYQSILRGHTTFVEAALNDAILLYRDLNKPKEAMILFEKIIEQSSAKKDTNLETMARTHIAATYIELGDYKNAEEQFFRAAKLTSSKSDVLGFASKIYRKNKSPHQLTKLMERLVKDDEPSGLLYALLGETQSEDLQQHHKAISSFKNAILLEPQRGDFYNGIGLAYYRMKNQSEALKYFDQATKIDPNDATARYNQACVLSVMGDSDRAIGSLEEALSLDPRLMSNALTDVDFANIKKLPRFQNLVGSKEKKIEALPENEYIKFLDELAH